ncbi:amidohydrolase [Kitasatospora herbaricolor]|uniref:Amidohydrolase family protein n=1 Tax=Kitasatospora herbaricolor TaxID=68217 RepID=A0ABZ1WJC7_9ACTN|nr:amidohydrolase family protein [Kitasatospora herbaricolor]
MNADLIVRVARVENFDPAPGPRTDTVVAVQDGDIVAVGGQEVVRSWAGAATDLLEFPGATLTPGLTDAHAHPVWGAIEVGTGLDLGGLTTLDAVYARIADRLAEQAPGAWLTGFDLDVNVFEAGPTGRPLEQRFPGVPISLMTRDAHSLVISPAAVDRIGLTGAETFDDASEIVLGPDGRPNGFVVELRAMDLVLAHYPEVPLPVAAGHVAARLREFAATGLTGLHALDFAAPSEEVYREIERTGELALRVRCSPLVPADSGPEVWEAVAAQQGIGGRRWHVAGAKFMLDGTADNGSAWFEHPDVLGQNRRPLWKDVAGYRQAVRFFTGRGIPTATHAIGDQAVRTALDVIEECGHAGSAPHRIEHIESIPDDLLPRFAALGVVAGLQPAHATRMTRADQRDNWSHRIGPRRAAHGWRTRDLLDHGAVVAIGSDWPVGVGDPRAVLADSQLRRPVDRPSTAPVQPGQRISAREAYAAMTRAPALAAGATGRLGRIAPGHLADLTVFARNPLDLTPEQQAVNPVLATLVGGSVLRHSPRERAS